MKRYFSNWNFMRFFRLALGIVIIGQGVIEKEWLFIGLGSLFALMPLMNMGCCSVSGCSTPAPKFKQNTEDITYEEDH